MMLQTETPKAGETLAVLKTNMGDIKFRLFPQYAPKAVENFTTHAVGPCRTFLSV